MYEYIVQEAEDENVVRRNRNSKFRVIANIPFRGKKTIVITVACRKESGRSWMQCSLVMNTDG